MKTPIITLLVSLAAINITAQTSPLKKWSFGAELFPNSTFMNFTDDGTAVGQNSRKFEISKFCLSGQAYTSYNLNKKMSISIGLGYQNTGNKTVKYQAVHLDELDSKSGFIDSTGKYSSIHFVYAHHNIQVPLFYSYNISNKFYVRSGISTIFNFSNSLAEVWESNTEIDKNLRKDNSTDFRSVNFSGNIGFGYSYYKSSKIDLYVQANLETTFMQLYKNTSLNSRPVSIGLIFGARI